VASNLNLKMRIMEWRGSIGNCSVVLTGRDKIMTRITVSTLQDFDFISLKLKHLVRDFHMDFPGGLISLSKLYLCQSGQIRKCEDPPVNSIPVEFNERLRVNIFELVDTKSWKVECDSRAVRLVSSIGGLGRNVTLLSESITRGDWKPHLDTYDVGIPFLSQINSNSEISPKDLSKFNKEWFPEGAYVRAGLYREALRDGSYKIFDQKKLSKLFFNLYHQFIGDSKFDMENTLWKLQSIREESTMSNQRVQDLINDMLGGTGILKESDIAKAGGSWADEVEEEAKTSEDDKNKSDDDQRKPLFQLTDNVLGGDELEKYIEDIDFRTYTIEERQAIKEFQAFGLVEKHNLFNVIFRMIEYTYEDMTPARLLDASNMTLELPVPTAMVASLAVGCYLESVKLTSDAAELSAEFIDIRRQMSIMLGDGPSNLSVSETRSRLRGLEERALAAPPSERASVDKKLVAEREHLQLLERAHAEGKGELNSIFGESFRMMLYKILENLNQMGMSEYGSDCFEAGYMEAIRDEENKTPEEIEIMDEMLSNETDQEKEIRRKSYISLLFSRLKTELKYYAFTLEKTRIISGEGRLNCVNSLTRSHASEEFLSLFCQKFQISLLVKFRDGLTRLIVPFDSTIIEDITELQYDIRNGEIEWI
jgi:hypothetical protein